jgi:hypothetical protein
MELIVTKIIEILLEFCEGFEDEFFREQGSVRVRLSKPSLKAHQQEIIFFIIFYNEKGLIF